MAVHLLDKWVVSSFYWEDQFERYVSVRTCTYAHMGGWVLSFSDPETILSVPPTALNGVTSPWTHTSFLYGSWGFKLGSLCLCNKQSYLTEPFS